MPAPITVLMPTLNAAADMPRALASLGEGLTEGLIRELIVSDGGSTDATLDIADAAGATIVTTRAATAQWPVAPKRASPLCTASCTSAGPPGTGPLCWNQSQ